MSTALLTIYVLIWPVLVAVVLAVISRGFIKDWMEARRNGEDLVYALTVITEAFCCRWWRSPCVGHRDWRYSCSVQHTGAKSLTGPPAVHDELVHLTRQLMTGDRQSEDQPSIAQHSFLSFIGRNDGCRATEISDVFGVNRSTISRQVRGCIDAGWVFADPGPVRQGNPLHLTDAGRTYLDAADARRLDQVTSRLQDWSEAEIAEFARALHRFRISTESQTNGDENL